MEKILLVDGNLLLFRAFYAAYAINKNSANLPTHLFFKSILDAINQEDPQYLFIAFDAHAKTKRHQLFQDYKAGRQSPPPEIYQQKQLIASLLDLAKIKQWEQAGDEADDLIATLATKYCNQYQIVIFSEDKDLLQLVQSNIEILAKDKKDKKSYLKINPNNFKDFYQIEPWQILDYKAIAGDSSDNLKGVKGIGDKTAISLLNQYQNLENIYENLDQLTKSQQTKFIDSKDDAFLCKSLAKLNTEVDLDFNLDDLKFYFHNFLNAAFLDQLQKANLKNLYDLFKKWQNEYY